MKPTIWILLIYMFTSNYILSQKNDISFSLTSFIGTSNLTSKIKGYTSLGTYTVDYNINSSPILLLGVGISAEKKISEIIELNLMTGFLRDGYIYKIQDKSINFYNSNLRSFMELNAILYFFTNSNSTNNRRKNKRSSKLNIIPYTIIGSHFDFNLYSNSTYDGLNTNQELNAFQLGYNIGLGCKIKQLKLAILVSNSITDIINLSSGSSKLRKLLINSSIPFSKFKKKSRKNYH